MGNYRDIRFFSLGIGSECYEILVGGIAEIGNGIVEFVENSEQITDKVVFLLEENMKYYLKNLKVDFLNKPKNQDIYNYNKDSKLFFLGKDKEYSSMSSIID